MPESELLHVIISMNTIINSLQTARSVIDDIKYRNAFTPEGTEAFNQEQETLTELINEMSARAANIAE